MLSNFKRPDEITALEVLCYWERMKEKTWGIGYSVFRSPNKDLKAIVCDDLQAVAVMWDVNTGFVYQNHHDAGLAMMRQLGYEPKQERLEAKE